MPFQVLGSEFRVGEDAAWGRCSGMTFRTHNPQPRTSNQGLLNPHSLAQSVSICVHLWLKKYPVRLPITDDRSLFAPAYSLLTFYGT